MDTSLHRLRPSWSSSVWGKKYEHDVRALHTIVPVADLYREPSSTAAVDSQLLYGEPVSVHGSRDGWLWVQSGWDKYQGYVPAEVFGLGEQKATHQVCVPRTFRYRAPDLKAACVDALSLASQVAVVSVERTEDGPYAVLSDGLCVYANHLMPIDEYEHDWVRTACTVLNTPYLWAGRSGFGLDCSALVQLALRMAGRSAPRDSDMQMELLGEFMPRATSIADLREADLVFWKGHVGIISGRDHLLHANARTMQVSEEPLEEAIDRIAKLYGKPTGFRRLGIERS
jgi:cell wall-associated NlpC family hydrolase